MIALGCDHGGFELKQEIIAYLKARKIEYKDFGCYDNKSVDYPVYAKLVGKAIQSGECEKGILIYGTGEKNMSLPFRKRCDTIRKNKKCVCTADYLGYGGRKWQY